MHRYIMHWIQIWVQVRPGSGIMIFRLGLNKILPFSLELGFG